MEKRCLTLKTGLNRGKDQLEEPFNSDENDRPINALVRAIGCNILFSLGEGSLTPVNDMLYYK